MKHNRMLQLPLQPTVGVRAKPQDRAARGSLVRAAASKNSQQKNAGLYFTYQEVDPEAAKEVPVEKGGFGVFGVPQWMRMWAHASSCAIKSLPPYREAAGRVCMGAQGTGFFWASP